MNISRKIILPAVSVILISWLDLNAKANTDKIQPQLLVDSVDSTAQCSEAINTNVKSCFISSKLVKGNRQL